MTTAPDEKLPSPPPERSEKRRPDWMLMTQKFLKHGTAIASFSPSSGFLSRAMLRGIDFDKAQCIIELGAGTGPITAELLKRVKPHTKLIVVERDPDFCARLRARFPGADIAEADAAKMDELLDSRGIPTVDHVVSGLPLPSFPAELRDAIIASSARRLSPEGDFRQLTNMPYVYWRLYRKYFQQVKFELVPLNMPPGGVYTCKKYRTDAPGNNPASA
ncbi:class I SAM-dependent methyltransferase [Tuwongella immobilis]|uniref:Ribosomal RNA adenine methylase transferase N-terminal domain-containing protein n=1 Tax=Tuwongella immobilis TaxID=692036 RepID=A0A6C2YI65_9BACT|nr:methyltransferase domain-containing protein [Tuwongella immobilis]VIP00959.1 sam-dependent methyltransferase : Ribosomal RNA adenine methylase transferase OS=Isosphaera pallida (strain ATCC 43644 / DSM 9630 / IS1B) GN=Isop_2139 PE=4 SV=1: RrnaAD [Tuwongella immobilis]VTR97336.1 sam-dependent methyltransferase : Ribosomal RNA adenine methylase transferase OS=Isosphaera pallida (strain ATCC 43644 / DSM 9630 / IS1B) GN=Isop_2139 PE=4 SV=1: RrnaAD [Tuwongella immobilis]